MGPGFTEWRNVVSARPLFRATVSRSCPPISASTTCACPRSRARRPTSRDHGIDGFCYYHYWFHGRRLLERPFDEVLASASPISLLPVLGERELDAALGRPTGEMLIEQTLLR